MAFPDLRYRCCPQAIGENKNLGENRKFDRSRRQASCGRNSWSLCRATTEVVSSVSNSTKRSRLPGRSSRGSVRKYANLIPPHLFLSKKYPHTIICFLIFFLLFSPVLQSPEPVSFFPHESNSKSYGDGHSTSEPATGKSQDVIG